MRVIPSALMLLALATAAGSVLPARAAEDGVALAIIYDTSGSMKDNVREKSGGSAPKYVIANRALKAVAAQLETYVTNTAPGSARSLQVGLFVFQNDGAREALKFGPFDRSALDNFASRFSSPAGNTPLGNALNTAYKAVMASPLSRKHILVLTDGINTAGPTPADILPRLKADAQRKEATLSVHFIAFDIDAKVFEPVKRLGATVVGAADEKQLNAQLDYILQRKILLEEEEPKKP